jgi:hypothetical protein
MTGSKWTAIPCLLLALTPELASAQARDPAAASAQARDAAVASVQARDPAAAEALFRRGREAMEAQRYVEALPSFIESQRLEPAAGTLMNIATCEEKIGRLASAWQHWREAMDALAPTDDRVTFARNRIQSLEHKLPRLAVSLASGRDRGARVFRDDVELGPATQGVPLPVDAGSHTITVRTPGHHLEQVVVQLREGEQKRLAVQPGAVEAPPAAFDTQPNAWRKTLGWTLTGVGVAGLGTAAVSGLMLLDNKQTVETNCPQKNCMNQEGLDAAATGRTLTTVNTASWIAGGVGLAAGLYFLLSAGRSDKGTTGILPSFGRDGAAVWCKGSF